MQKCSFKIPVSTENSTYCISAEGIFDDLMVGTPSEENCISVPFSKTLSKRILMLH